MLYGLLIAVHVLVSVILILVVLLQTGKRADLAGAFGGGGSQTAFGARGTATVFSKATTACAVIFMVTSLALAIATSRSASERRTVLDEVETAPVSAPASPEEQDAITPIPPPEPTTGESEAREDVSDPLSSPPQSVDPESDPGPADEVP